MTPRGANETGRTRHRVLLCLVAAFLIAAVMASGFLASLAAPALQPQPTATTVETEACLDCHGTPGLSMALASGEVIDVTVERQVLASSVHAGLNCTDCHTEITGFPHSPVVEQTRRDYSTARRDLCQRCHFDQHTKTLDSIHFGALGQGEPSAPVCTDCHGYHSVADPSGAPSAVSFQCSQCHGQVYDAYAGSVHGAALEVGGNPDVPVCTDCHQVHTPATTDVATLRANVPQTCAECHADGELMDLYGLNSNVFDTYVRDFHGATVALAREQDPAASVAVAVCTDCHGVHDIQPMAGTMEQVRQRALEMCRGCHPDAGENYPDAWLGHYEISLEDAPLAWLVRAFYWVLIPFMLVGLMLHIVVDLWQVARNGT